MLKTWKNAFLELLFSVAPKFDNFNCESWDYPHISSALDSYSEKPEQNCPGFLQPNERKFTAIFNFFQVVLVGKRN